MVDRHVRMNGESIERTSKANRKIVRGIVLIEPDLRPANAAQDQHHVPAACFTAGLHQQQVMMFDRIADRLLFLGD
ncbi:MAG: hypothetical protein R2845_03050 [Thermomicrobiales bacterium]